MRGVKLAGLLLPAAILPLACTGNVSGGGERSETNERTGTLNLSISGDGNNHDVASVSFTVVPQGQPCSGPAVQEKDVPLQALQGETLPPFSPDGGSVLPEGGGGNHPFSDAFFVLNPGQFTVCASPFDAMGNPSAECQQATSDATVFAGATTEVLLVMQCTGTQNGGLDAVGILNTPPAITGLIIGPSKFIHTFPCENDVAIARAEASDPDGDALTFTWELLDTGNSITGETITIHAGTAVEDLQVLLIVADVFGASTSLQFPIHVSACPEGTVGPDAAPVAPTLSP
jgi:hypothetical protein